jgi:hypothetical protein
MVVVVQLEMSFYNLFAEFAFRLQGHYFLKDKRLYGLKDFRSLLESTD